MGFETGRCGYIVKWRITTYTSGNELRGTPAYLGDFESERDARQHLADNDFTDGEFGWRKGYVDASIARVVQYDFT
tara:strand:+ start:296 stop:523 length:228 start_codon:yes stop_codon:yes gene_type:complete